MPINRFYLESAFQVGKTASIEGAELHHLRTVLRHQAGDHLELINGKGDLAAAKILTLERQRAELSILSLQYEPFPSSFITLAIPAMRLSKLEWIVEKAVELGVLRFCIYRAHLSEKAEIFPSQMHRLITIAASSLKQSGRLHLPSFELLPHLQAITSRENNLLFGDLEGKMALPQPLPLSPLFISGPESGFSDEEKKILQTTARGVKLCSHTLRAETAPIAAAMILQFLLCF